MLDLNTNTKGKCIYCKQVLTKRKMLNHLKDFEHFLDDTKELSTEHFFRIFIEGYKIFWLAMDIRADQAFADLDAFLRYIWLECCGHMSRFQIGNEVFDDEESMEIEVGDILEPGLKFTHEYDFGTTTVLELKVLGEYEGSLEKNTLMKILVRNLKPEIKCFDCEKRLAEFIDQEGTYQFLCEECARNQGYGIEELLPYVNSPRTGQCGYTGDDEYEDF